MKQIQILSAMFLICCTSRAAQISKITESSAPSASTLSQERKNELWDELWSAVENLDEQKAREAISKGADIRNQTLFHLMILHGKEDRVAFMLKLGADVTVQDKYGNTAEVYANLVSSHLSRPRILAILEHHRMLKKQGDESEKKLDHVDS